MIESKILSPTQFDDYELIDCGNFEKLERFGKYILIRPEPQALWNRKYETSKWLALAHRKFEQINSNSGEWQQIKAMPSEWQLHYQPKAYHIAFKLKFTAFKHIGVFPEQSVHWDYLFSFIKKMKYEPGTPPKALNLFAYTGGASLVAKAAGADVVHVDSIKQVVTWANENRELSGLKNIRWTVEDALKFAQRELKRGNTYNAIIMDPPAYGLGPKGERWILEEKLNELMETAIQLLDPTNNCLIVNTYSLNLSPLILVNFIKNSSKKFENIEIGELYNPSTTGYYLPLGSYMRFANHG
jgi:23S rRNA (cytosine1962-C5)-methyltransferase